MVTSQSGDLGRVLLGKTRGLVLGLLLDRPEEEFHIRRIVRLTGAGLGPAQRELALLADVGVLNRREVGRQVFYSANRDCPVYQELCGLTAKTVGVVAMLKAALEPVAARIRAAFLFGSMAEGRQHSESDADVMVVGDLPFAQLARLLAGPQRRLAREVNPVLYPPAEFIAKLRQGHHFLAAVMRGPKIFLVGDEHELSRLAQERVAAPPPDKPGRNRRATRGRRSRPVGQRRSEP